MNANQWQRSTHMSSESNANPKQSKPNVNLIGGIPVEFPFPPYGSQLAYMSRVISTLDRAQRDGHFHALLESPTGTGKSLSLLCSVLAWQRNYRSKYNYVGPEDMSDPIGVGGGFVPEMESSSANEMPTFSETNIANQRKKITIYYATRTHAQISQVIGEFRKTSYRVPMAVLGSRKRYCTNPNVRGKDNIDERCKLLVKQNKKKKVGCRQFTNAPRIRAHPSLRKGGCYEVHDIEDLVKVGEMVEGCSYYGAQALAEVADIVFCPYNYIINPQIRKAMEINLRGNIIILDEAHNIEDICRDSGSIDVEEGVLCLLLRELENLCESNLQIYQPLYEMIEGIMSWISLRKISLGKLSSQLKASCWSGDKALNELQEATISMQCFPGLQDCATQAIRLAAEADPEVNTLSGLPCTVLEDLFSSLTCFFSEDGRHICDYQLVLQCQISNDAGISEDDWPCTFSLWCLNPAIVFRNMARGALSVILTSGTLSPMSSFQSELGVRFGTSLEAPHVINVDSQLWAGVIHTGPDNYPLNASYKTSEAYGFQDALGTSLEEICKVVPGGCLVFFPSYKVMDKLRSRWCQTGQWARLDAQKTIFVEPRGGQEEFEHVLQDYYDTIRHGSKRVTGRRRGKKWDVNSCNATKNNGNLKGAIFLAVCRGKVSEGMNFSDDFARTVIIVGIPFSNVFDIQVAEKKKYNDTYKSSKGLLSGNEWYCQQAFRALNQAAGRCIRHRFDYGAIIFLDERFRQEKNLTYISKWIRKSIRQHDSFDQSLEGLKSFFGDFKIKKEQVDTNGSSVQPIDVELIDVDEPRNLFIEIKDIKPNINGQRYVSDNVTAPKTISKNFDAGEPRNWFTEVDTKPNLKGQSFVSDDVTAAKITSKIIELDEPRNWFTEMKDTKPNLKGQSSVSDNVKAPTITPKMEKFADMTTESKAQKLRPCSISDNKTGIPYVDLEDDLETENRCSSPLVIILSPDDIDGTVVEETLKNNDPENLIAKETPVKETSSVTFESVSEDVLSNSTIYQAKLPDHQLPHSFSSPCSTSAFVTPNKQYISQNRSPLLESSVNSRFHKRLKTSVDKMESLDSPDPKTSATIFGDAMKKDLKLTCLLCKHQLGLEENNYFVSCSTMSLSKMHLASIWKGKLEESAVGPTSVPVMVSDITSVDRRIWETSPKQGIWSEEDGCVFNKIICSFCNNQENCLGLHVAATDSSNVQLLNKVLFNSDKLEIQHVDVSRNKELSPSSTVTSDTKSPSQDPFDQYAYAHPETNSGGWRNTNSKMRLPKKIQNSQNIDA